MADYPIVHMTWRKSIGRLWMICGLSFTAWMIWNMQSHGVPAETLQSSSAVVVERGDDATAFLPRAARADDPFIVFLPGGAVDPRAYVPVVRAWAEAGWTTVLVELPWRMAFTEHARAELWRRIAAARVRWGGTRPMVLGGHSRGAALSARFAFEHEGELSGLMLIGTTHPRDQDLSSLRTPVVKVSGTRDCVASEADSRANLHRLPSDTTWVSLTGANHAQFGYYGRQLGDCSASIDRPEQQRQLREALMAWLKGLGQTSGAMQLELRRAAPAAPR